MQLGEFRLHQDEKHKIYQLITQDGKLAGISETGEIRGKLYLREDGEIKEDFYREVVRAFAREDVPELKRFMTEIRKDNRYFQIARDEILKMMTDLQSVIC